MQRPKTTSTGKFRVWALENRVWIGYCPDLNTDIASGRKPSDPDNKFGPTSLVFLRNSSGDRRTKNIDELTYESH